MISDVFLIQCRNVFDLVYNGPVEGKYSNLEDGKKVFANDLVLAWNLLQENMDQASLPDDLQKAVRILGQLARNFIENRITEDDTQPQGLPSGTAPKINPFSTIDKVLTRYPVKDSSKVTEITHVNARRKAGAATPGPVRRMHGNTRVKPVPGPVQRMHGNGNGNTRVKPVPGPVQRMHGNGNGNTRVKPVPGPSQSAYTKAPCQPPKLNQALFAKMLENQAKYQRVVDEQGSPLPNEQIDKNSIDPSATDEINIMKQEIQALDGAMKILEQERECVYDKFDDIVEAMTEYQVNSPSSSDTRIALNNHNLLAKFEPLYEVINSNREFLDCETISAPKAMQIARRLSRELLAMFKVQTKQCQDRVRNAENGKVMPLEHPKVSRSTMRM